MLGTASYMVVAHVIIVSAPVQKIGFWGFSEFVRTLGSGSGACWDMGLGLGLGLDNYHLWIYASKLLTPHMGAEALYSFKEVSRG